jgi:hypothetical protein
MLLATDLSTGLTGDYIYNTSLKTFCYRMPDVAEEPDLAFPHGNLSFTNTFASPFYGFV